MRWLILVGLLVVLVACSEQPLVCSDPYIAVNGKCCIDTDADGACDPQPENDAPLECSLCPPKFVTEIEEVIVYKYVCMNGSVMNAASSCEERIVSNAHLFTVLKDQDDTLIDDFDTRPACRGKYKAVEIHIDPIPLASQILVQVMDDPEGSFMDLYEFDAKKEILDDEYMYIGLCDDFDCTLVTEAQLLPDKAYKFRARVVIDGETLYTRERLVDPTPTGEYNQKRC